MLTNFKITILIFHKTWWVILENNILFCNKSKSSNQDFCEEPIYKKLLSNSKKQLEVILTGTINRLDWHFYRTMNRSFIEALIEKPREALVNLMEFYGIDTPNDMNGLKFIIYSCLRIFFLNNTQYTEKAFELIMSSSYREYHELIKEFLTKLKKTSTSTIYNES